MPLIKHLINEYTSSQKQDIIRDTNFNIGIEVEAKFIGEFGDKDNPWEFIKKHLLSFIDDVNDKLQHDKSFIKHFISLKDLSEPGVYSIDKKIKTIFDIYDVLPEDDNSNSIDNMISFMESQPNEFKNFVEEVILEYVEFYQHILDKEDFTQPDFDMNFTHHIQKSKFLEYFWDWFNDKGLQEIFYNDIDYYFNKEAKRRNISNWTFSYEGGGFVEIINIDLFNTIDQAIEWYKEIIDIFNSLDHLYELNENTSAHINMSYNNSDDPNLIKGILFMNEDMASKNLRQNSKHAQKYVDQIKTIINEYIKQFVVFKLKLRETSETDEKEVFKLFQHKKFIDSINSQIIKQLKSNIKELGFNFSKLFENPDNRYVEFRYPSSDADVGVLHENMIYYGHIIKLMFDSSYMNKEYNKRLYKLISKAINS